MKVECSHQEHFLFVSYLKYLRPHKGLRRVGVRFFTLFPCLEFVLVKNFAIPMLVMSQYSLPRSQPHGHRYYIIVASKHLELIPRPLEHTFLSWPTNPIVSNWQEVKIYILNSNLFCSLCSQWLFLVMGNDHWEHNEPKRLLRDWIDKEQPLWMQWTENVLGRPDWMRSSSTMDGL